MTDLRGLRHEYVHRGGDFDELPVPPMFLFRRWLDQAVEEGIREPNAMVVSTVSPEGQPSSRIVLLKGLVDEAAADDRPARSGFVFYTNHLSRKGRELAHEPRCALVFPWHDMERQVRVEGVAELLPREEVEDYFAERPRGSQLGAHASAQSQEIADRAALEAAYADVEARFEGRDIPAPEHWGGYVVRPTLIEFWKGGPARLHDRLEYRRSSGGGWSVQRLQP